MINNDLIKNNKKIYFIIALLFFINKIIFSLSNPFLFYFSFNLFSQVLISILIFIPFWLLKVKNQLIMLNTNIKKISFFLMLVLLIIILNYNIKDKTKIQITINNNKYSDIYSPLGEKANILELNKDDILVDINLPRYYNLYHIDGSCNLNPNELLNNKKLRKELEKYNGKIYLICEWRKHIYDFYNYLISSGVSTDKWQILEAGQMFYRLLKLNKIEKEPPNFINKKLEFEEAYTNRKSIKYIGQNFSNFNHKALNFAYKINTIKYNSFGQEISYKFGPKYAKSWILSIIGNNKSWRQYSFSFLYDNEYQKVVKIFIDDCSQFPFLMKSQYYCIKEDDIFIFSGFINNNLEFFDKIAGKKIEEAIFICDNNQSSFAAESLALDLINRGGKVHGYIIGQASVYKILSNKKMKIIFDLMKYFYGFEFILYILFMIIVYKLENVVFLWIEKINYSNTFRKKVILLKIIDLFIRFIGISYSFFLGYILIKTGKASLLLNKIFLGVYLQDVTRLNYSFFTIIPFLTYILLFNNIIRNTPKSNSILLKIIFLSLSTYLTGNFIKIYINETINLFGAMSLFFILLIQNFRKNIASILFFLKKKNSINSIFTLVPLEYVENIKAAGKKAISLSIIHKLGFQIPKSYVLITTFKDFNINYKNNTIHNNQEWLKIKKILKKSFGNQKLIIRSSAPDEDIEGKTTAGFYTSIINTDLKNIEKSIFKVLYSYKERGIKKSIKLSVIIQQLLKFDYSGVAIREDITQGGNILIEASKGNNFSITSGKGADFIGQIGCISNKWIKGNLNNSIIKNTNFVKIYTVLEKKFKNPIDIEWGLLNDNLILLQVRTLNYKKDILHKENPAYVLNLLKNDLKKNLYYNKIILDIGELVDYQYGTSIATTELIEMLYSNNGPQSQIGGSFYKILSNLGPDPGIIKINQGIYFNLVPKKPFLFLLIKPFINITNLYFKIILKYILLDLEKCIIDSRDTLNILNQNDKFNKKISIIIKDLLNFRENLINTNAKYLLEIALIIKACFKKNSFKKIKNKDPFLTFLANNTNKKYQPEFYYRSINELSLELPRYGEIKLRRKNQTISQYTNIQKILHDRPNIKFTKDFILYLQALARDNLSYCIYLLRLKYLILGKLTGLKEKIFNLATNDLINLCNKKNLKNKAIKYDEIINDKKINLPHKFNLMLLENWATGDFLSLLNNESPFWIYGKGEFQGIVTKNLSKFLRNNKSLILVLKYPLVNIIYKLPTNSTIIALSGNRLCHAALIAKEKKINSLFSAYSYEKILKEGNRIKINKDGSISLINAFN